MKNVTDTFKVDMKTYGRQLDVKMKINENTDIDSDNLNYIKPSFNTDLFKTVMHKIEIDSNIYFPKKTKIDVKLGIKVNEKNYEYIEYKGYYVYSCERQEDTNSYIVIAYSKMQEAMIEFDLNITKKIKLRDYLIRVCQRLGWNTSNIPATFINSEKIIDPTLHIGIKYTFRDVLDEIATISCSFIFFKEGILQLKYLTDTKEVIDEEYLDEDNITIGEKYFINSLVFSRAEESDNIYRKDDENIVQNGLHEYRVSDCQLLSTNDRDIYIDEMFDYLKTLNFYIYDVQSKGILFLEVCDIFTFFLSNIEYPVILLNNEISIEDGISENMYFDEPKETETDYKYADETDKRINQTYIIVDKQKQVIEQQANQILEHEEKITRVEQNVDNISQKVENTVDYKRKSEGLNQLKIEDVRNGIAMRFITSGNREYNNYLYPMEGLFAGEMQSVNYFV